MLKSTIVLLLVIGTAVWLNLGRTSPAVAQTPGNDPWSWCNYHSYSQPFNEEACEEELSEIQSNYQPQATSPLPTLTPYPNGYPGPTVVPSEQIRSLFEQQARLTAYFLMDHYSNPTDAANRRQAVDANTQFLAAAAGATYGQNSQLGLVRLLQQHISILKEYTDSVRIKSHNSIGIDKAVLNDNIGYMAAYFQNSEHSAADLRILFERQANDEMGIIDNYALGNQQAVNDLMSQLTDDADRIADAVTGPSGGFAPTVTPTP